MTAARELTTYSAVVDGDRANLQRPVRFDITDGYVGITQSDAGTLFIGCERVLLSPMQWRALLRFVAKERRRRRVTG
jgi:hypothetical protein